MLKLNASYSKKVPVEGQEFSSQSYHAAVEVEIPDGLGEDQLRQRIHDTFALVKTSVESELHNGDTPASSVDSRRAPEPFRGNARSRNNGNGGAKATGKQLGFLTDLAARRGLDVQDLNERASRQFGVSDINELTRKQASGLIDFLNGVEKSPGRRAA